MKRCSHAEDSHADYGNTKDSDDDPSGGAEPEEVYDAFLAADSDDDYGNATSKSDIQAPDLTEPTTQTNVDGAAGDGTINSDSDEQQYDDEMRTQMPDARLQREISQATTRNRHSRYVTTDTTPAARHHTAPSIFYFPNAAAATTHAVAQPAANAQPHGTTPRNRSAASITSDRKLATKQSREHRSPQKQKEPHPKRQQQKGEGETDEREAGVLDEREKGAIPPPDAGEPPATSMSRPWEGREWSPPQPWSPLMPTGAPLAATLEQPTEGEGATSHTGELTATKGGGMKQPLDYIPPTKGSKGGTRSKGKHKASHGQRMMTKNRGKPEHNIPEP